MCFFIIIALLVLIFLHSRYKVDEERQKSSTLKISVKSESAYSNVHPRVPNVLSAKKKRFSDHPLSPNYFLWSQNADSIDWSESEKMCQEILSPYASESALTKARSWTIPSEHTDPSIFHLLSDCHQFRRLIHFPTIPASDEERDFPLAYVFVGPHHGAQSIRFLRMIYQPQNAYCFVYDNKSIKYYKNTIRKFHNCFSTGNNVYMNPKPETIDWCSDALLRSEMACLKVLLDRWNETRWRYVQMVSWNDFPLRTNLEMVKIFKIFNGSQDTSELVPVGLHKIKGRMKNQIIPDFVSPGGLPFYKGNHATSMSKEFVEFLFTNPISIRLYEYLNGTNCGEELYWQTLIYNLRFEAPGSFPGECLQEYQNRKTQIRLVSRYQVWVWDPERGRDRYCKGKFTSSSCVFGVGDLSTLITRPELMAHKLYEEFEPATSFCLEQWFWKKRRQNSLDGFDVKYYEELPIVRYRKAKNKSDFVC